jgi:phage/plasmid primase-like uncharacterized protein
MIGVLRDDEGAASHGQDAAHSNVGQEEALFAAQASDAVIGLLTTCHRPDVGSKRDRIAYDDSTDFNDYVDSLHVSPVIMGLTFAPSAVLFNCDQEAYREALAAYGDREHED